MQRQNNGSGERGQQGRGWVTEGRGAGVGFWVGRCACVWWQGVPGGCGYCLDTGGVHGKNEWNASDGQGWGQRDRGTTHRRKSSDRYHTGGSGVLIIVQKRGRTRAIKERAGGTCGGPATHKDKESNRVKNSGRWPQRQHVLQQAAARGLAEATEATQRMHQGCWPASLLLMNLRLAGALSGAVDAAAGGGRGRHDVAAGGCRAGRKRAGQVCSRMGRRRGAH